MTQFYHSQFLQPIQQLQSTGHLQNQKSKRDHISKQLNSHLQLLHLLNKVVIGTKKKRDHKQKPKKKKSSGRHCKRKFTQDSSTQFSPKSNEATQQFKPASKITFEIQDDFHWGNRTPESLQCEPDASLHGSTTRNEMK